VIAGSRELMFRARMEKHRFGGAMRQAGIVAAAGVYALENNIDRLADDHRRARQLGEAWAEAGLSVDLELVETNFVQVDVGLLGLTVEDALSRIREEGVMLSPTRPGVLRAVTSLEIDDDAIERAASAIPRALEAVRV
jgi:threonine aldolase